MFVMGNLFHGIAQNLPHYVMMCLVYTTWMSCRGVGNGLISVIKARGWRYLLLALIDVEACTLVTSSHQFTSLAGIQVRANDVTWHFNVTLCQTTATTAVLCFRTVYAKWDINYLRSSTTEMKGNPRQSLTRERMTRNERVCGLRTGERRSFTRWKHFRFES